MDIDSFLKLNIDDFRLYKLDTVYVKNLDWNPEIFFVVDCDTFSINEYIFWESILFKLQDQSFDRVVVTNEFAQYDNPLFYEWVSCNCI